MGEKQKARTDTLVALRGALPGQTAAIMLLVVLVVIASALYTHRIFVAAASEKQLLQLSQLEARQRAEVIGAYIQGKQKQLDGFSSRDSMLNAVQTGRPEALATALTALQLTFPEALSIRLFGLDRKERRLTASADQALSFIEQDMINRAEQGDPVAAELIRVENDWQLLLISPIASAADAAVSGTVLAALPAAPLLQAMASKQSLGQARLLRETPGRPFVIYQTGSGDAGQAATVSVASSDWQVEFRPSPKLAAEARQSPLLLIAIHVLIGAGLLILVWQLRHKVAASRATTLASKHPGKAAAAGASDILDIQISSEDAGILVLEEHDNDERQPPASPPSAIELPGNVFRAYDIRGIATTEITAEFARLVGQAVASEALAAGETALYVARDGRSHSPELCEALIEGVLSTGCQMIYLGAVPTPLLYFATCEFEASNSGVMVTASHNSAEYNGFKIVIQGKTLVAEGVQRIKQRMSSGDLFQGRGERLEQQVIADYIDRIFSDVALAGSVKLVVDAGNGITGEVAPLLFEELGCEVVPLHCEVDGRFPNHDPDPTIVANLQDLIATVQSSGADLGVALDGDGDRLVVVTPKGDIIWPDRLLMLFARDIVSGNPGADVLFDVKSTRELNALVSSYGGRPIMWKTGHSNMKTKMQETGALVGGEMSGHIFIKDRWYGFDDGMYAAARLLEIMTLRDQDIDSLFASFPSPPSTPELKIAVNEADKFALIEQLKKQAQFENGSANTLDGMRVEFPTGWGLVRASNTSAALTLRFEADSEEELQAIQALFKRELSKVDSSLQFPF
ncbi:phosphomannomutase/phosphoglucomutase [Pseudomaricurvus alcaniphilus]|uniref:phosphomannomutase/phosphoglucomutase n=1 Tax=Pseudomaricurvus alcaniphilus TaxID=1166482 RepID=UPI001409DE6A|nr:phosphomannomutase/phosphoglucomutase [Pseudomaricurvus alcaniphilus]